MGSIIVRAAVDSFRNVVEVRGEFTTQGLSPGNQRLLWHGTNRNCNVGESGRTSLCSFPQCSLCRIIKASFDVAYSKKKTGWGRFGNGVYTSSTSSKFVGYPSSVTIVLILVSRSNDYSKNLLPSPWKAIILAYVVVGNAKKFTTSQPTLTRAPAGFDSVRSIPSSPSRPLVTFLQVVGEPSVGGCLNYDELTVYNNDAVRPGYLVMYDS